VPVAFAAAPVATLLPMVPASYLAVLAGLAVLPSFQEAGTAIAPPLNTLVAFGDMTLPTASAESCCREPATHKGQLVETHIPGRQRRRAARCSTGGQALCL
jgi:hypothetical protein